MAFSRDEITSVLFEAVGKAIKRDPTTLSPELRWVEDLDFRSVQGMKVCGILNYRLKVTVPLSKLIECTTLEDSVEMLSRLVN